MSEENKDAGTIGTGGGKGTDNVDAQIEAALAKRQAKDIVRDAWDDAYKARERARVAESKIPADGAVVLTGDDAAEYAKFRGLGKFADVNKRLGDGKAASDKLADIERTEQLQGLGKLAGMNPPVFARLAKTDGLEFETKEEKGQGDAKVVRVFVKGEGDKLTPVDEYAADRWPEFLPSLKPGKAEPERRPGTPPPNPHLTPPPRPSKGQEEDVFRDLPYQYAPPAM